MDNTNIDFTAIWHQQKVVQPNIYELKSKMNLFKKNNLKKLIVFNVLLIATIVFVTFIWYKFQPQFITTKFGIILVVLAMFFFLLAFNKQLSIFKKIDDTLAISDYLKSLSELKIKQKFIQTTMLRFYFIMLSLGIVLYMYEYALVMSTSGAIFAYAVTLIWIGVNWFYIRPKIIKKQQAKLNELINKFEDLDKQLYRS